MFQANSLKEAALEAVLQHLGELLTLCSEQKHDQCMAEVIHAATPDVLLKKLMVLAFDAVCITNSFCKDHPGGMGCRTV